jgi:hypothetical protein
MQSVPLPGVITLLLAFLLAPAWAQRAPIAPPIAPTPNAQASTPAETDPSLQRQMRKEQLHKRFQDIQRDSQKLLQLATELKQYVDKSGEGILSMDVLRKAEEMEKLARQVKNNMRAE